MRCTNNKIKTTVIGSFPKPEYLKIPDWFNLGTTSTTSNIENNYFNNLPKDHNNNILRAIKEIISFKDSIGIDIIVDGEARRSNYIHYHCRHLNGISFDKLTSKTARNNSYTFDAPTIISKISPNKHFLLDEWKYNSSLTDKPIKVTIPGPMTIVDTVANLYYDNDEEMYDDIIEALNYEILHLANNGCKYIQIDEPVFARYPDNAVKFGIKNLERCFLNVPNDVTKIVHMCCGYPDKLDDIDYPKADNNLYIKLLELLDNTIIDQVSLEDAHRFNDLSVLLPKAKRITVILGVIGIARSRIETVEEIENRIYEALKYISHQQLVIAPDCGLGLLPIDICKKKLINMTSAVKNINNKLKLD